MCFFPSFFVASFAGFLPFLLFLRPVSFWLLPSTKVLKENFMVAVHNVRPQLCCFLVNRNGADTAVAL